MEQEIDLKGYKHSKSQPLSGLKIAAKTHESRKVVIRFSMGNKVLERASLTVDVDAATVVIDRARGYCAIRKDADGWKLNRRGGQSSYGGKLEITIPQSILPYQETPATIKVDSLVFGDGFFEFKWPWKAGE
jgi:hypothetical protein